MPECSIRERLAAPAPLLLDGATGTELARRGIEIEVPEWSTRALLTAPEIVQSVHASYVAAGAELVTANTFRTHARNLSAAGLEARSAELTRLAVKLAREAAGDASWIAGSQAPLEDCYSPQLTPPTADLEVEHGRMARCLADCGVDVILVETQPTIREAVIAAGAAASTGVPTFVSFVCGSDARLLSGETIHDAIDAVRGCRSAAILVNCLPSTAVPAALRAMRACADVPIGAYANIGYADSRGQWVSTGDVDPVVYAARAREWVDAGARIVGGCCGTTPEHVAAMRRLLASHS